MNVSTLRATFLPPEQHEAMIMKCVAYTAGRRVAEIRLEDISELLKRPDTFVWLGLREPDPATLHKIQEEFSLHELAVEDTRSAHQRPKLEEYGDTLFLVFRTAEYLDGCVQIGESHAFVGPNFLVTVRHGNSPGYSRVRERCESMPKSLAHGPGFALYSVMDFIVDNYMPVADALRQRLESVEEDIFMRRPNRAILEDLYELKREMLQLRDAVSPLLDISNELMRSHGKVVPKEIRFYYRDVHDHVRRISQALDSMREMLTTAMQVHLALITVGQNEIVKRLAGWGAILAIPTMVFSLYGMNFKVMPELDWTYSYPITLCVVAVACLWLYRRLKFFGWL